MYDYRSGYLGLRSGQLSLSFSPRANIDLKNRSHWGKPLYNSNDYGDNMDINMLKATVFEAGKSVSVSTMFLLFAATILIIATYLSEPNEKIQIALFGLTLNKVNAVSLLFILYNAAFLRFVLCMNHHKCLYWQLVLKTPREDASGLWVVIYPSAINYILNHRLIYGGGRFGVNAVFAASAVLVIAILPACTIFYLYKNHGGNLFPLISASFSLFIYWLTVYNMKADLEKARNIIE